jgi:hypothetical protein
MRGIEKKSEGRENFGNQNSRNGKEKRISPRRQGEKNTHTSQRRACVGHPGMDLFFILPSAEALGFLMASHVAGMKIYRFRTLRP